MPRPDAKRLRASVNALREHRKRPEISLETYVALKRAGLWASVRGRKRVYLDTRFWIFLRDAELGRPKHDSHVLLLQTLRELVQSGQMICPLSDGSLLEVLHQSDGTTRIATARLMDELSTGAAIQNAQDRLQTEFFFLLAQPVGAALSPPVESVWFKPAYTLGLIHPEAEGFDQAEQRALAKGFFDLMWSMSLEELLVETPELPDEIYQGFRETAADLTAASRRYAYEVRDWRGLYGDEVRGFIDVHADDIQAVLLANYKKAHPAKPLPSSDELSQSSRETANFLSNLIIMGKAGNALPRAQVEAGVHAIVRWHRTRPFSAQDFVDIHHATAALPYCHLFLTERFLGTALSKPPLDLARQFGVEVVWDADAAVEAVIALASRTDC